MRVDFYSSSFCAPCAAARSVLDDAAKLLPQLEIVERNVAQHPDAADADRIGSTPTMIVRSGDGAEVYRAEGVPSVNQLLVALARAV
ncbi:thioredoxin family protein [Schumannella soli]|uniref:Thioredoxin family protein n=1 Tax=Schumannella soli TaxID=2590779 RepID=A0A506XWL4_9MICO|nr:thioredoxin family protein [Schumannella soli]TPW74596.1 thioredoxin family protein [Schumannella soli]